MFLNVRCPAVAFRSAEKATIFKEHVARSRHQDGLSS